MAQYWKLEQCLEEDGEVGSREMANVERYRPDRLQAWLSQGTRQSLVGCVGKSDPVQAGDMAVCESKKLPSCGALTEPFRSRLNKSPKRFFDL